MNVKQKLFDDLEALRNNETLTHVCSVERDTSIRSYKVPHLVVQCVVHNRHHHKSYDETLMLTESAARKLLAALQAALDTPTPEFPPGAGREWLAYVFNWKTPAGRRDSTNEDGIEAGIDPNTTEDL